MECELPLEIMVFTSSYTDVRYGLEQRRKCTSLFYFKNFAIFEKLARFRVTLSIQS